VSHEQREERVRTGRDGHRVRDAVRVRELPLERRDLGTEDELARQQDPARRRLELRQEGRVLSRQIEERNVARGHRRRRGHGCASQGSAAARVDVRIRTWFPFGLQ